MAVEGEVWQIQDNMNIQRRIWERKQKYLLRFETCEVKYWKVQKFDGHFGTEKRIDDARY